MPPVNSAASRCFSLTFLGAERSSFCPTFHLLLKSCLTRAPTNPGPSRRTDGTVKDRQDLLLLGPTTTISYHFLLFFSERQAPLGACREPTGSATTTTTTVLLLGRATSRATTSRVASVMQQIRSRFWPGGRPL